jgi:hypothetical protein
MSNLVSPNLTFTLAPPGLIMPQEGQELLIWLFGGGAVLLVLYTVYQSINRRSVLPLLFPLAGACSIMLEPVADLLGNVMHPPVGQVNAFVAKGQPIPWHVLFGYIWYYSILSIVLFNRFQARTMTSALWWKCALWVAVGVTVFEQIPIYYGIWVYYGTHAFKVGFMPLSMAAANTASVILPSLIVYRLMPILTGWRQVLVLLLVPCVVVGTHSGASIPSYIALGQDTATVPTWVLQAGAGLTTIYSLMLIWLGINLVHNRFPEQDAYADAVLSPRRQKGTQIRTSAVDVR